MYKKYIKYALVILAAIFAVVMVVELAVIQFKIYKSFFGNHIVAQFDELVPINKPMPVYYKGFKVGVTGRIKPNADYSAVDIRILLNKKLNKLPSNISAKITHGEDKSKGDYMEIIYPALPSNKFVKSGTVIKGEKTVDIKAFMDSQAASGSLTIISDNMGKTLESAQKTSDEAREMIKDMRQILQQNSKSIAQLTQNISAATKGLSKTSDNLGEIMEKLNVSMEKPEVEKVMGNLTEISQNLAETTRHVNESAKNVEKITEGVELITNDVNVITTETKNTLSERYGMMRLLFGTPIKNKSGKP